MIDTAEKNCSFADLESTLARMRIAESRSKTRRVLYHRCTKTCHEWSNILTHGSLTTPHCCTHSQRETVLYS
jgi:hypothetical protein